jgi:hypothetical protein
MSVPRNAAATPLMFGKLMGNIRSVRRNRRNDGCRVDCEHERTDDSRLPWSTTGYGGWGGHAHHRTEPGADRTPVVFVHGLATYLGGAGNLTASVQVVGYALGPLAFVFVPLVLAGFGFILPVVLLAVLPVILGIGVLLYIGVGELHGLGRTRSLAVVAGTLLGLALVAFIVMAEMAVAG